MLPRNKKKGCLFSEKTLKKCQRILDLRKHQNLKYENVISPLDLYACGYHRICYCVFKALKSKFYTKDTKLKMLLHRLNLIRYQRWHYLSEQQPSTKTDNCMIAKIVTQDVNLTMDSSALDGVVMESNNFQLDTLSGAGFVEHYLTY